LNKTYYYAKDIKFLSHEKLLEKFRELKIYERKIKKAKAKNEKFDMKKLLENKPKYSIDHILKERYPRFLDAINDLDDALCLVSLFASLPKHELLNIKTETIVECQRLLREFYLYCAVSKNFRKGFISIKGIYLNVEIMNYDITWLSPIHSQQKLTFDVDYEIMTNFLELYISLMKFVNLKLYKDIGMDYPPPKENYDIPFFGLNSLDINGIQDKVVARSERDKNKVNYFIYYLFK
jgi:pescadillo